MSTLVINKFLNKLSAHKVKVAVESLQNPGELSEGRFGRVVGRMEGLREAEEILNGILAEEKKGGI